MSALADIDVERLGQPGTADTDPGLETMTGDVAIAAAGKMLRQRQRSQRCKI